MRQDYSGGRVTPVAIWQNSPPAGLSWFAPYLGRRAFSLRPSAQEARQRANVGQAVPRGGENGSLSPAARCAYIELKFIYNGVNNGTIGLSARRLGERIHVSKNTAARALQELRDKGVIERATPGGFHRKVRHATEWRLSEERCDRSNQPPTKAFMRWGQEKKSRSH